ncbi:hypothetical protein CDD82_3566 [Ophiocordyceps australis]|uniref:Uncharacterized protein n=1 Tax=Ophiocordyceps australis TaxID=1399860 RepID=A0A2C5ZBS9_9HYPO|nr:hypothetical protein CDD82_3566 [Ophiocordyceps australis]
MDYDSPPAPPSEIPALFNVADLKRALEQNEALRRQEMQQVIARLDKIIALLASMHASRTASPEPQQPNQEYTSEAIPEAIKEESPLCLKDAPLEPQSNQIPHRIEKLEKQSQALKARVSNLEKYGLTHNRWSYIRPC